MMKWLQKICRSAKDSSSELICSLLPLPGRVHFNYWLFISSWGSWDTHFHQVLASEASTYPCLWSATVWKCIFWQIWFLLLCPLSLLLLFLFSLCWVENLRNVIWTESWVELSGHWVGGAREGSSHWKREQIGLHWLTAIMEMKGASFYSSLQALRINDPYHFPIKTLVYKGLDWAGRFPPKLELGEWTVQVLVCVSNVPLFISKSTVHAMGWACFSPADFSWLLCRVSNLPFGNDLSWC